MAANTIHRFKEATTDGVGKVCTSSVLPIKSPSPFKRFFGGPVRVNEG
jgi:hypothetical protein